MPRLTENQEFCPVARSLEVLGERWTLLIVRDLVTGPKRFGDLQRLVVGITPKWLTTRLRALESAGIVERAGREYRLTHAGEDLRPLVQELALWATKNDLRAPKAGEVIIAEHEMWGLEVYLNRANVKLLRPAEWLIRLTDQDDHTFRFDGQAWKWDRGASGQSPEITLTTTSRKWAALLASAHARRKARSAGFRLEGDAARTREFKKLFLIED